VRLNGENYEFSKSLRGSLGEYITLNSSGQNIGDMWKMKAVNKEGIFEKIYPIPDQ
jgi:predicted heme/steroid binding protein